MILGAVNWAGVAVIISAVIVTGTAILGRLKWVFDHEIRDVNERLSAQAGEFRPNGGHSFRDHFDHQVHSLRIHFDETVAQNQRLHRKALRRMESLEQRIDKLDARFNDFDRRKASEQPR
jgi:BMFP domain-containing protein YqiC